MGRRATLSALLTLALGAPLGACVEPPFPNGGSARGGGAGFGGSSSSDGGTASGDGGADGAGDGGVLPGVLFSRVASGSGDGAAVAVAVDGSGAAVVLGSFRGTLDFGGATPTAGSNGSAFLARYDATGKLGWLKTFPASAADALSLTALAVTTTGDVVIAGGCAGTVDLGGGALAGGSDSDVCLARYDSAGKHRLSRRLGDNAAQSARAVALDDAGAIFLGGALAGTMTIDGTTLRSAGQKDAFLVKLDSTGKLVFGRSAGDGSDQEVQALRPDGEGGVVAAGSFVGSITLDGVSAPLTSNGVQKTLFVGRLKADGALRWQRSYPVTLAALAVTKGGRHAISGPLGAAVDFGGGPLSDPNAAAYLVFLDDAGKVQQQTTLGGAGGGFATGGMAFDGSGRLILGGAFRGTVNPGGGEVSAAGAAQPLLLRYGSDGKFQLQARPFASNGPADTQLNALALDGKGAAVLAGAVQGTVTFGQTTATATNLDPYVVRPTL